MMRECFDRDGVIDFGGTPPLPPELVAVLCKVTGIRSLGVLGDIALQSHIYPLAGDRLPPDPDFIPVRNRANCHVEPFVSRDCGTLLLKLVSLSGVAIAN